LLKRKKRQTKPIISFLSFLYTLPFISIPECYMWISLPFFLRMNHNQAHKNHWSTAEGYLVKHKWPKKLLIKTRTQEHQTDWSVAGSTSNVNIK
jgi:hypothetical protein